MEDAAGHFYQYTYDAARRRNSLAYPDGTMERWQYNAMGKLVVYINRAGDQKTLTYDQFGALVSESWKTTNTPVVSYRYDEAGRLSEVDNKLVRLKYSYDEDSRVVAESTDLSGVISGIPASTVRFTFNARGQREAMDYPTGEHVSYAYDAQQRLISIGEDGAPIAAYSYGADGNVESISRSNGVTTSIDYSVEGQIVKEQHLKGSQVIVSSKYEMDILGRRVRHSFDDQLANRYAYDAAGNLSTASYPSGRTESFSYDGTGNRLISTRSANSATSSSKVYTVNQLNQYTKVDGVEMKYSQNGDLISDGKRILVYNSAKQLVAVDAVNAYVEFVYDPKGRCVVRKVFNKFADGTRKINSAESRLLTYDGGWNVITERKLDLSPSRTYVLGRDVDEVVKAKIGSKTVFPLTDGLGSTVALTNDSGVVEQRFTYDAFGMPQIGTPEGGLHNIELYSHLYTGREWLSSIELADHRNRYYDPELGRWTTSDPIGLEGGPNMYSYVGNVPTMYTDRLGLMYEDDPAYQALKACEAGCKQTYPRPCAPRIQCLRDCMKEFSEAKQSTRPEPYEFSSESSALQWLRDHAAEVALGAVVVVGVTVYVVGTLGTGAIVLVAVGTGAVVGG